VIVNLQLPELLIVLVFLLIVALVIGGVVYAAVRLANRDRK